MSAYMDVTGKPSTGEPHFSFPYSRIGRSYKTDEQRIAYTQSLIHITLYHCVSDTCLWKKRMNQNPVVGNCKPTGSRVSRRRRPTSSKRISSALGNVPL